MNLVAQKDGAALIGAEGAALVFLVDFGLAPVCGQIRNLKRRFGSADHLGDHRRELLFELRVIGGWVEA